MRPVLRQLAAVVACTLGLPSGALADRPDIEAIHAQLQSIDTSAFTVTDPLAGYFDAPARRVVLKHATNPDLRTWADRHAMGISCQSVLAQPIPDYEIVLPGFYTDNTAWREMVNVFLQFEDSVSALAAAEMVLQDGYSANCLVDVLLKWARAGALERFVYDPESPQAWYTTESTLFAAAFALMTVRDLVSDTRAAALREIDAWMLRVARRHSGISGLPSAACCNNHLLRRGTYAMSIGIMTQDDPLFRFGVRAFLMALSEARGKGHLPMEISRGRRAVHYQNFATMYLVYLAEMMQRQGYDAYAIKVNGRGLSDIIDVTLDLLDDPTGVIALGVTEQQILPHQRDGQFLSWLEPYYARTGDARAMHLMAGRRPLYNRSLGGYTSLFFMDPATEPQSQVRISDAHVAPLGEIGARREFSPVDR